MKKLLLLLPSFAVLFLAWCSDVQPQTNQMNTSVILTGDELLYNQNDELNKKIFYLRTIAENVAIHLYDDKFWVGNEKTTADFQHAVELRDQWTKEYFQKLIKENAIENSYVKKFDFRITADWVTKNRPSPSFHSDDVYKAYLSSSEYQRRLPEIQAKQLEEQKKKKR